MKSNTTGCWCGITYVHSKTKKCKEVEYQIEQMFFEKRWVTFWWKKNLDAFRGNIFPSKTSDRHSDDLERILTPEPPITAPIKENISDIP